MNSESPRLPRSIQQHLEIYPHSFATARGLEHIDANGNPVVLVALRRLNEHHPWLPQGPDEIGTPASAPVTPQSTVVEVINEQTQPAPLEEKQDGPVDGAAPSQSTQGENSTGDAGPVTGTHEEPVNPDAKDTTTDADDSTDDGDGQSNGDTNSDPAAEAKAAKRAARKAAKAAKATQA